MKHEVETCVKQETKNKMGGPVTRQSNKTTAQLSIPTVQNYQQF
jgi:hypothetical protein